MSQTEIPDFRTALLTWYGRQKRDLPWRRTSDPFCIWISEVMLQQTQVNTVIPYYHRFLEQFPDVDQLADADLTDLLKRWEGLGYYSRARNLHQAAGIVVSEHDSRIPNDYKLFHQLPGVGDYIAAAVQSIAFNQPFAVVDGNVKRVLARLQKIRQPVNQSRSKPVFQKAADRLLAIDQPGDYNQAMMELGALICTPKNPDCGNCPVSFYCKSLQDNTIDRFPVREKRKAVPVHQIAIGIVFKEDRILITLRKPEGLLGGLWEFPGGKIEPGESAADGCIREIREETGLNVSVESALAPIRHAYTHFKIEMSVFICQYRSGRVRLQGPVNHQWIRFNQVDRFPFPKANHKIFPQLEAYLSAKG